MQMVSRMRVKNYDGRHLDMIPLFGVEVVDANILFVSSFRGRVIILGWLRKWLQQIFLPFLLDSFILTRSNSYHLIQLIRRSTMCGTVTVEPIHLLSTHLLDGWWCPRMKREVPTTTCFDNIWMDICRRCKDWKATKRTMMWDIVI